jgi:hypothetical protein
MVSRARLIDASEATLTEMHDISCRNMYICHVSNFIFERLSSAENKRKIRDKRNSKKFTESSLNQVTHGILHKYGYGTCI